MEEKIFWVVPKKTWDRQLHILFLKIITLMFEIEVSIDFCCWIYIEYVILNMCYIDIYPNYRDVLNVIY